MSIHQTGAKNGQWKGGRSVASNGYVLIRVGKDHPSADSRGYAYEHRLVMEQALGRPLLSAEQIHHKDGDKRNNAPDNLELTKSLADHRVRHRRQGSRLRLPGEANPTVSCACGCGGELLRYDRLGRPREFLNRHSTPERPTVDAILACLADGPKARTQIADLTCLPIRALATALSKLKRAGLAEQVSHGVWRRKESSHG